MLYYLLIIQYLKDHNEKRINKNKKNQKRFLLLAEPKAKYKKQKKFDLMSLEQ